MLLWNHPLWIVFVFGIVAGMYRTLHGLSRVEIALMAASGRRATMHVDVEEHEKYEYSATHSQRHLRRPAKDIAVFYNLYVNASTEEDLQGVTDIVNEQFSYMQPWHRPVFVHSIGQEYPIPNTTLLQHHKQATEMVTLQSLWEYCQDVSNVNASVVYLHSKGTFHPSPENDILRRFNTLGALSDDCSNLPLDNTCNVCSARFSPLPHPHPPGNMFLARCEYVQHLPAPVDFEDDMDRVKRQVVGGNVPSFLHPSFFGIGRYAAEHWIHSHPYAKPCDLYTHPQYHWGYSYLEDFDNDGEGEITTFDLQPAPRFPRKEWRLRSPYCDLQHRLNEYQVLFRDDDDDNSTTAVVVPPDDWWGWDFWWEDV